MFIGYDQIIGLGEDFFIPHSIIMALHRSEIFTWSQLIEDWQGVSLYGRIFNIWALVKIMPSSGPVL